jgi:hypothetical protein
VRIQDAHDFSFIIPDMARGWESKSVEEQMEARVADAGKAPVRPVNAAEVARDQKRQGLLLARARVLQQIEKAQNPAAPEGRTTLAEKQADSSTLAAGHALDGADHRLTEHRLAYRKMLEQALADLERQFAAL